MDNFNYPSIVTEDGSSKFQEELDKALARGPGGSRMSAMGDNFYGLNHRQQPAQIPINKDVYGLTFFTRPQLNLTTGNLRAERLLTPLANTDPNSIQRIIRCLLDHRLEAQYGINSPFVDPQQAFIPILTNSLLSMSGWPDVVVPYATSPQGVYKEEHIRVDGLAKNYSAYDITANFRNLAGDPITALMFYWAHYSSLVMEGVLNPYPDMIINNEMDYTTRIYRLVLDVTKTKVQKIAACGAAFPTNAPMAQAFDFEADRPMNQSRDQISIHMQCAIAMYQDDILIEEFNATVGMFNDLMSKRAFSKAAARGNNGKSVTVWTNPYHKQVPMDALAIFNNRGYPRIDPETYELQWWVTNEDYQERLGWLQDQETSRHTANWNSQDVQVGYTQPRPRLATS
ncbi:hypothetical protein D3C71_79390 [compost metagenome]